MPKLTSVARTALKKALEKFWLKENKFITAVELDKKRFGYEYKKEQINNKYVFDYDEFPMNKNIFQYIQELRVFQQPDDLSICDNFFGHDIKKILIWDKPLPKKYCKIQKQRNSLEEVYIYSKTGFNHLSIISPSCRKLNIKYFNSRNVLYLSHKNLIPPCCPSIEHLIIHEISDFYTEWIKLLCEIISKTFPNLKQLEMNFNYTDMSSARYYELTDSDAELFKDLPSTIKGKIKTTTFVMDQKYEERMEILSVVNKIFGKNEIIEKVEIHDGLFFESSIYFLDEYFLQHQKFYGNESIISKSEPFWFRNFELCKKDNFDDDKYMYYLDDGYYDDHGYDDYVDSDDDEDENDDDDDSDDDMIDQHPK